MAEESGEPQRIEIQDECRACPACDYTNGFHVSFVAREAGGLAPRTIIPPRTVARASDCGYTTGRAGRRAAGPR